MARNRTPQTPFDDLVPGAPTTPLPPPAPPPDNNTLPLAGRTNAPAARVVAALQQDDEPDNDAASYDPPTANLAPRRAMPTGTLVGLAMVGGALIVLGLGVAFQRVVPRAPTKSMPAPIQPSTPVVTTPDGDFDEPTAAEEAAAARRAAARLKATQVAPGATVPAAVAVATAEPPAVGDVPDATDDTDASLGTTHRGNGYRISPPSGFSLQKTGRRTVWSGPGGSQLIVETSNAAGRSPRDDWEQLDRALAKKYGDRYRSRGITETTMAGKPAAVWEFEIGNTRKIDIAVHHGGKGYAVLGEALVGDFETMRPQFEAAMKSFELAAKSEAAGDATIERVDGNRARQKRSRDTSDNGY